MWYLSPDFFLPDLEFADDIVVRGQSGFSTAYCESYRFLRKDHGTKTHSTCTGRPGQPMYINAKITGQVHAFTYLGPVFLLNGQA